MQRFYFKNFTCAQARVMRHGVNGTVCTDSCNFLEITWKFPFHPTLFAAAFWHEQQKEKAEHGNVRQLSQHVHAKSSRYSVPLELWLRCVRLTVAVGWC